MLDFHELRELAADVRVFVDVAEDKAEALRAVVAAYDVVLAIFPSEEGMGLHVIKGKRSWMESQIHGSTRVTATRLSPFPTCNTHKR